MDREFNDVPKMYYEENKNGGVMVQVTYTSNTYDEENRCIDKDALVYLPAGYEKESRDYNVFYLMHGGGGDSNEIFGGMEAKTDLKTIVDNMIENGDIEPLIIVAPSFYYKGTDDAKTSTKDARLLTQNFDKELVCDLIPFIEGKFRAKKGRWHRLFGGYSMGAEATWNIFTKCINEFKYFLPMSGDCWAVELQGGLKCPKETVDHLEKCIDKSSEKEFKIFACVGDDGVAYAAMDSMMGEMKKRTDYFKFAQDFNDGNIVYCVAKGGTHTYEYCYKYIYNALPDMFKHHTDN